MHWIIINILFDYVIIFSVFFLIFEISKKHYGTPSTYHRIGGICGILRSVGSVEALDP